MTSGLLSSLFPSAYQPPGELQKLGRCPVCRPAALWPSAPPSERRVWGKPHFPCRSPIGGALKPALLETHSNRAPGRRLCGRRRRGRRPPGGALAAGSVSPRASGWQPGGCSSDRPRWIPAARGPDTCSRRLRLRLRLRGRCFLIGLPLIDMAAVAFGWAHCGCPESPGRASRSKARPGRRGAVAEASGSAPECAGPWGARRGRGGPRAVPLCVHPWSPGTRAGARAQGVFLTCPATSQTLAQHDTDQSPVRRDSPVPSVCASHQAEPEEAEAEVPQVSGPLSPLTARGLHQLCPAAKPALSKPRVIHVRVRRSGW